MRPLRELLDGDPGCDRLLELVDGCGELDRDIYLRLLEADDPKSVEELAETVDRDRSTTYRSMRRLHENGYLEREQVTYENGGYCYRYRPVDPEDVAASLRDRLATCHDRLDELVDEFRETYSQQADQ